MKKYFKSKVFLLAAFLMLLCNVNAQVGVNTLDAFSNSELDIRNEVVGNDTIAKGVLIPRMTEAQRTLIDVKSAESNSLLIYNTSEDCFNYYDKLNNDWKSLCGTLGKASFSPLTCDDISIFGTYVESVSGTLMNYVALKTTVLEPGAYSINITTNNGYYFVLSGTALVAGELILNIPCFGKPIKAGTDDLVIKGISLNDKDCKPQIVVNSEIANYSINCSSVVVVGNYSKGTPLNGTTNYIEVGVSVSKLGSYTIQTEIKNGIAFGTSGVFTKLGTNIIRLLGSGSPTMNEDFGVIVNTNSQSGATQCTVTIPIILPAMTYAIIGGNNAYSWAGSPRSQVMANKTKIFKEDGIVKIIGLTSLWTTSVADVAAKLLVDGSDQGLFPDIVLFNAFGVSSNKALGEALSTYISRGGCVIYGASDGNANEVNLILNGVFGSKYATARAQVGGRQGSDNAYPVAKNVADPIIKGPFGNASGRYWGEDNLSRGSIILTSLPPNSVQVVTAYNETGKPSVNPAYSMVWYSDSYNFVYFGDSTGASATGLLTSSYPAYYPSNFPSTKYYGASPQYVYNSILEMNAVAWCLKKAAINGINPH